MSTENSSPKKHRHKRHYTFMVISGDSDGSTKSFHLDHFKAQLLAYAAFAVVLVIVCYIVYSAIPIHNLRSVGAQQKEKIDDLITESSTLEASNDELSTKVQQLSAALNQRLEDEAVSAEEAENMAMPTGFPLTGTAANPDHAMDDPNETTVTKVTEENEDTLTGNPILLFESSAGNTVIATGSGKVLTVTTDVKFGNIVTIDHGNGYVSIYRNAGDPLVAEGTLIDKGSVIFAISDSNTTLGYQIQQDDKYLDPEDLIEING